MDYLFPVIEYNLTDADEHVAIPAVEGQKLTVYGIQIEVDSEDQEVIDRYRINIIPEGQNRLLMAPAQNFKGLIDIANGKVGEGLSIQRVSEDEVNAIIRILYLQQEIDFVPFLPWPIEV